MSNYNEKTITSVSDCAPSFDWWAGTSTAAKAILASDYYAPMIELDTLATAAINAAIRALPVDADIDDYHDCFCAGDIDQMALQVAAKYDLIDRGINDRFVTTLG